MGFANSLVASFTGLFGQVLINDEPKLSSASVHGSSEQSGFPLSSMSIVSSSSGQMSRPSQTPSPSLSVKAQKQDGDKNVEQPVPVKHSVPLA